MIQLHDKQFVPYISEKEINTAIKKIASELNTDYSTKKPLLIGVLNGSFMVVSDLMKALKFDLELSFVKFSSYEGTESTGRVNELIGFNQDLRGRDVIIIEDIVDTGNTLEKVLTILNKSGANSVKIATLLFKPTVFDKKYEINYVGLKIPNIFVVGYGLDYNELGRNIKEIYKLKDNQMLNIVLFGPPGAGKGTQSELIQAKYNLTHLSTGDMFRFHMKNDTALGKKAKEYMEAGNLVPDELVIKMIENKLDESNNSKGYIFDGFPRTTDQAVALDELLSKKSSQINAMIALEVEEDELVKRLLLRGQESQRKDDQDESIIRNRMAVYNKETAPLKNFYSNQDKFIGVNGLGTIEEINGRINSAIDS